MKHLALACSGLLLSIAAADAKDLCITKLLPFGPGVVGVVLKQVKLGRRQFGPVHGFLRENGFVSFPGGSSTNWIPVSGQGLTSSTGELAVGLVRYPVGINVFIPLLQPALPPTAGPEGTALSPVTIICQPLSGGAVGLSSPCTVGAENFEVASCSGEELP